MRMPTLGLSWIKHCLTVFCAVCLWPCAAAATLTVGLYPYVPRVGQFQTAIEEAWQQRHPDIPLHFLGEQAWDGGYRLDPPAQADVFIFDAIYLAYFKEKQFLEPLKPSEVAGLDDYFPYAVRGVFDGHDYYAIPQLGCADLLFYHKDDTALAQVQTLTQLQQVMQTCQYCGQIPPRHQGLMIDLSGQTTVPAYYLDAVHRIDNRLPFRLPMTSAEVNGEAIAQLRTLLAMASVLNATQSTKSAYQNAIWFNEGRGRAYVNFSESMSQLSPQVRAQTAVKILPLTDSERGQAAFYADIIAVHSAAKQRANRALAVELANLIASPAVMIRSLDRQSSLPPQYLLPTRRSVFKTLAERDATYHQLLQLVHGLQPVLFTLPAQSRSWLATMSTPLQDQVFGQPTCGRRLLHSQVNRLHPIRQAVCP